MITRGCTDNDSGPDGTRWDGSSGVVDASATEALLPSAFIEGVGCKMVSTCTSFSQSVD